MHLPEAILTLTDGVTVWRVGVVGAAHVDPAARTVTVPDPDDPAEPIVVADFLIVEFARAGIHGFRLLSELPAATMAAENRQDGASIGGA